MSVCTEISIPPLLASGMIAPLARAKSAVEKLITLASGTGLRYGKTRRSPASVAWIAVMFIAAALAVFGTPQLLILMIVKLRTVVAAREGPPWGPTGSRVSMTRQGVRGKKLYGPATVARAASQDRSPMPASRNRRAVFLIMLKLLLAR